MLWMQHNSFSMCVFFFFFKQTLIYGVNKELRVIPAKWNEQSSASALTAPAQHLNLILTEAVGSRALQQKAV